VRGVADQHHRAAVPDRGRRKILHDVGADVAAGGADDLTYQRQIAGEQLEASLTINYRTPQEVMAEAEPVIRAVLPDANIPTSIRHTGVPVTHAPASERDTILGAWLAAHAEGTAAVIGDPTFATTPRVRSLTPEQAKGLEFDLVILIDPQTFGNDIEGTVDRYVAMTRATQQLVILTSP
jgi:DNA helicase IV